MVVDLGFWERGNAQIVRSYLIKTAENDGNAAGEKFVANILPAVSNFPTGASFEPIYGSSHQQAKVRAISAIRSRPENAGLLSFTKIA